MSDLLNKKNGNNIISCGLEERDIFQYFKENVYPIILKNNCSKQIINTHKEYEKWLIKNKEIITRIEFIQSDIEGIPFENIKIYFICKICSKEKHYHFQRYNLRNKSIIRIDSFHKKLGYNNMKELYQKPLKQECVHCSNSRVISCKDDLIKWFEEHKPEILELFEISNDNKYPINHQTEKANQLGKYY